MKQGTTGNSRNTQSFLESSGHGDQNIYNTTTAKALNKYGGKSASMSNDPQSGRKSRKQRQQDKLSRNDSKGSELANKNVN